MKKTISYLASAGLMTASLFAVGCAEKEGVKTETEIQSPTGTTTITEETEVKQTGENPPAVSIEPETPPAP